MYRETEDKPPFAVAMNKGCEKKLEQTLQVQQEDPDNVSACVVELIELLYPAFIFSK
jgi:hypothetical protein